MHWWRLGASGQMDTALQLSFGEGLFYVLTIPFPMVGIMALMELIPASAHERQMRALRHGKISESGAGGTRSSSLEKALERLSDTAHDGTVLGVSRSGGKPVIMPDDDVNQMALVLGTTGGGKTVTLRRFYRRAMLANYLLLCRSSCGNDRLMEACHSMPVVFFSSITTKFLRMLPAILRSASRFLSIAT